MKTLAEFTKTTLIGGVLIILPIYVSVLLLAKAAKGLLALISPITAGIPASLEFREVIAVLGLAAVCFVAGLVVRTGPGLRAKNAFEQAVLERLPGYTLLRGLAARFTGQSDESTFAPALVEIEEALVPALIIEELEKLAKETEFAAGYVRVRTPNLARESLYITSGHLPYYKESMFPPMEVHETGDQKPETRTLGSIVLSCIMRTFRG
jgi:uncharacterized membrane protein